MSGPVDAERDESRTTARFVVIEGPPGCSRMVVAHRRASGQVVADGFVLTRHDPPRSVRCGVVADADDAAAALLAALAGHDLVVEARSDPETLDRFVDDLRHLGSLDQRTSTAEADVPLSLDALALLSLLGQGMTLGDAATRLAISRRTADRRLAEVRTRLGARRTAQAIATARREGWLT